MRVRKRKGAEEHLANHPQYVILEPEAAKGKWHQIFGNDNPIHIEVGSGKGALEWPNKILISTTLVLISSYLF